MAKKRSKKRTPTQLEHRRAQPLVASRAWGRSDLWILIGLALATFAVYAQVAGHEFISLDDDLYIRDNPIIVRGLTWPGIVWAFTTFHAANWHPLTWLSHMCDSQFFGLRAGGHLLVNASIHVANSLLLFWFLRRATGARWASAMVAALFALHPMHVESVAWAAERKDTLAAFFGLLTLLAYLRYVERTSSKSYALVVLFLALGLMAKPMLVTWPFVLLLLDYWPFRRLQFQPAEGFKRFLRDAWPLVREKILLFALVAVSMVVTYIAQSRGGTVRALVEASVSLRLTNAIVSYAKYFLATFWPTGLAVYYPFAANGIPPLQVAGALLLVFAVSAFVLFQARARPFLLIGWLWFLGTLVPVIGLVQVGGQAMADRYHYLPSIGLFIALVFGAAELIARLRIGRVSVAVIAGALLIVCATLTAVQVTYWRDSVTLFERTLAVTPDNLVIEYNLGHVLGDEGKYAEALPHFAKALRIDPNFADALINMGMTLSKQNRAAEAVGYFERALRVAPGSSKAHSQLALALVQENKKSEALEEFRRALQLAPRDADIRANLGLMLARQGEMKEAMEQLNEALRLNPNSAEAHNNMGLILLAQGQARESIPHFTAALRLKPNLAVARQNLERAEAQVKE